MEMLGKIRRLHLRDRMSLSEIAKRTGLSRNTVRKWLGEAKVAIPKYRRQERPGKLTAFEEQLKLALEADGRRPKRDRRTARLLWAQVKDKGYIGGYTLVSDFIRAWRGAAGQSLAGRAFVPLKFEQGCWRRLNIDHLCRLNIDQGRDAVH